MWQKSNDAVTSIAEKTAGPQMQIGGMFDKTLTAALNPRAEFDASVENLDRITEEIMETVRSAVQTQTGQNTELLAKLAAQLGEIRNNVSAVRESAEEFGSGDF